MNYGNNNIADQMRCHCSGLTGESSEDDQLKCSPVYCRQQDDQLVGCVRDQSRRKPRRPDRQSDKTG